MSPEKGDTVPMAEVDALVAQFGRVVEVLRQVLVDATSEDRGYFIVRPSTVNTVRSTLAHYGVLGELVTFRLVCPNCGWRTSWEQYEHEPGRFNGICRICATRCNGDSPAIVRGCAGAQVRDA